MPTSSSLPAVSALTHRRRGVARPFTRLRRGGASAAAAFLAVLGPGLLAGLSDDDPAGITTYALLGTDFGYRLLWVIPAATILLTYFHLLAVEIGTATGRGFVALVRERWGRSAGHAAAIGLLFANFGTICAEYAGIAAAAGMVGIPPWISAPLAGIVISCLVVLGSFQRIEGVLLVVSATLSLYLLDGVIASPDWRQVAWHTCVPHVPLDHAGWVALTATVGTTLAPWGLAFIQSYAVDKKVRRADLPMERIEVVAGSLLTGVIGLAIAVACAATLHQAGIRADSAEDVAVSLEPLAGRFATVLFGGGLLGAAVLAAAVVPIATAYSVAEGIGAPASLGLDAHRFHAFYAVFVGLTVAAVSVVAIPGLPLFPLMVASQVVNAVLLPLHVVALVLLAGRADGAGRPPVGVGMRVVGWLGVAAIVACVVALAASWVGT
ncbi:MAG: NRAMP family divalent metal transporter [Planctomycetaceae bacterium]